MNRNRLFTEAMLSVARGACICCAVYLFALRNGAVGAIYPIGLLPYSLLIFFYNRLILLKARSYGLLTALNLIPCAAFFVCVYLLQGFASFGKGAVALCFIGAVTVRACQDNIRSIGLHNVILCVDCSFLCLVVSVAVLYGISYSAEWALCAVLGAVAAFAGLIGYRMELLSTSGKLGVLAVGAGASLMISAAASKRLASGIGRALITVWNVLLAAVRYVLTLIERFFLWLASFAKPIEGDIELEAQEALPKLAMDTDELMPDLSWLVYVIVGIAVIGLLVYIIFFGKKRTVSVGKAAAMKMSGARVSLREAICRLISRLKAAAELRRRLREKRKTPAGIYLRLGKGPVKPRADETVTDYLSRLIGSGCVTKRDAPFLRELAPAVNRQLYSPAHSGSYEQAEAFLGIVPRMYAAYAASFLRALPIFSRQGNRNNRSRSQRGDIALQHNP